MMMTSPRWRHSDDEVDAGVESQAEVADGVDDAQLVQRKRNPLRRDLADQNPRAQEQARSMISVNTDTPGTHRSSIADP